MTILIAIALRFFWLGFEVYQRRRFPAAGDKDLDRHSGKLWDIANTIEVLGLVLAYFGVGHFDQSILVQLCALFLLTTGIAIRITAIKTLGHLFTSEVTIRNDHRIMTNGLYQYVRHPAYTGALIAHAGLGLAFGSWISLLLSTIPFLVAAFYRIRVEERALVLFFGQDYSRYAATTGRLFPKLH